MDVAVLLIDYLDLFAAFFPELAATGSHGSSSRVPFREDHSLSAIDSQVATWLAGRSLSAPGSCNHGTRPPFSGVSWGLWPKPPNKSPKKVSGPISESLG